MPCSRRDLLALLASPTLALAYRPAGAASAPPLMLARLLGPEQPPGDWWVSEKYDGVRGYWDGQHLLTRRGNRIAAPDWFTAGWPATPMDGELWTGRGRFEQTVGTVRQQQAGATAWQSVRYMVFDLPGHGGPFRERLAACASHTAALNQRWVQAVAQEPLADFAALPARLEQLVRAGGEGLMLQRSDGLYRPGRSDDLLKFKPWDDAEAQVIGHQPGRGRHAGRLGALLVRTSDGMTLRLGSGLSDTQRQNPPPVGSWVTFRYRGTTAAGVPRFAAFLRPYADS